ncbi:MAG: serine hydrolase [Actinobacteria bacterium]|nr:serine hydrolase [Actinomycetota bacterium]
MDRSPARPLAIGFASLVALVAAFALAVGTAAAKPLPAKDRKFVDGVVGKAMEGERLPGVSVTITGPQGNYTHAYGVADRATGAPYKVADHVRIASITKTFTATAILLQVAKGKLSLEDTIDRWLPTVPNANRITVRDLLAMRSGLYDFTAEPKFLREFTKNPMMKFSPWDVVRIEETHKPVAEPDSVTKYTDSNFVLLGLILEKVSGETVEKNITKEVIRPLGLKHTSFPATAAMPQPFAHGYFAGDEGDEKIRDYTAVNPKVAWTAGAMVSTLGDLRKYGRQLATGALLPPSLQAERLKFGDFPNGDGPSVGYGLGILHVGNWLGHDGAIFGFSTVTMYEPKSGTTIAATANLSSNFSTPTLEMFFQIAARLDPSSLAKGKTTMAGAARAVAARATKASGPTEQLTPVVGNPIASPEPVLASNGRRELAYELQLINRSSSTVTVRGLEALAGGKVVQKLAGKALAAQMQTYGTSEQTATLAPGQGAYVLMDVSLAAKAKVPAELVHRISVTSKPKLPAAIASSYEFAPTPVTNREAVVIASPLRGPNWVVGNGCCATFNAHRGTVLPVNGAPHVAERFAIDFIQIDPMGRLFEGSKNPLSNYSYFGDEIYSAAAGKVVGVVDGMPDIEAGSLPPSITAAEAGGNHVVVDIGGGRYAFYAHLQPGSVRVKVGQKVKAGQVLGLLGNSGNTDAPHLHFHLMDSPYPLLANGVPYRFANFTVDGEVTNVAAMEDGAVARIVRKEVGPRHAELPLDNQVVSFP